MKDGKKEVENSTLKFTGHEYFFMSVRSGEVALEFG